ncbi:MAG TPA: hypothetical protein VFA69_09155 [Candidatus Nitrosotalea sp.]|nr:hypothetical protein [Candidatus Nitrosotalea sp.]
MKIPHLSIIVAGGIIVSGIIAFFITSSTMIIPSSQSSGSIEDYDMQRILSVCSNPDITKQGNDVFVICQHPKNSTYTGIFNLPLITYKRVVCQSMYGCSGRYNYVPQIPADLLSSKQKQESIDKVLQDTGLKDRYPDIQLEHFIILASNDKWSADIQFIIPHIMNGYNHCGWYTSTQIDLQTFEVSPIGVPIGTQKC